MRRFLQSDAFAQNVGPLLLVSFVIGVALSLHQWAMPVPELPSPAMNPPILAEPYPPAPSLEPSGRVGWALLDLGDDGVWICRPDEANREFILDVDRCREITPILLELLLELEP